MPEGNSRSGQRMTFPQHASVDSNNNFNGNGSGQQQQLQGFGSFNNNHINMYQIGNYSPGPVLNTPQNPFPMPTGQQQPVDQQQPFGQQLIGLQQPVGSDNNYQQQMHPTMQQQMPMQNQTYGPGPMQVVQHNGPVPSQLPPQGSMEYVEHPVIPGSDYQHGHQDHQQMPNGHQIRSYLVAEGEILYEFLNLRDFPHKPTPTSIKCVGHQQLKKLGGHWFEPGKPDEGEPVKELGKSKCCWCNRFLENQRKRKIEPILLGISKKCDKCNKEREAHEFWKNLNEPDKIVVTCMGCRTTANSKANAKKAEIRNGNENGGADRRSSQGPRPSPSGSKPQNSPRRRNPSHKSTLSQRQRSSPYGANPSNPPNRRLLGGQLPLPTGGYQNDASSMHLPAQGQMGVDSMNGLVHPNHVQQVNSHLQGYYGHDNPNNAFPYGVENHRIAFPQGQLPTAGQGYSGDQNFNPGQPDAVNNPSGFASIIPNNSLPMPNQGPMAFGENFDGPMEAGLHIPTLDSPDAGFYNHGEDQSYNDASQYGQRIHQDPEHHNNFGYPSLPPASGPQPVIGNPFDNSLLPIASGSQEVNDHDFGDLSWPSMPPPQAEYDGGQVMDQFSPIPAPAQTQGQVQHVPTASQAPARANGVVTYMPFPDISASLALFESNANSNMEINTQPNLQPPANQTPFKLPDIPECCLFTPDEVAGPSSRQQAPRNTTPVNMPVPTASPQKPIASDSKNQMQHDTSGNDMLFGESSVQQEPSLQKASDNTKEAKVPVTRDEMDRMMNEAIAKAEEERANPTEESANPKDKIAKPEEEIVKPKEEIPKKGDEYRVHYNALLGRLILVPRESCPLSRGLDKFDKILAISNAKFALLEKEEMEKEAKEKAAKEKAAMEEAAMEMEIDMEFEKALAAME